MSTFDISESEKEFDNKLRISAFNQGMVRLDVESLNFDILSINTEIPTQSERIRLANELSHAYIRVKGISHIYPTIEGKKYDIILNTKSYHELANFDYLRQFNNVEKYLLLFLIPKIEEILSVSKFVEIPPNYNKNKETHKRDKQYGYSLDKIVHRLYAAVAINNKLYCIKTLLHEHKITKSLILYNVYKQKKGNRMGAKLK